MAQLVKTVQGLAIASVKTTQGLAIASVKTIMGVDNTAGSPAWTYSETVGSLDSDVSGLSGIAIFSEITLPAGAVTKLSIYTNGGSGNVKLALYNSSKVLLISGTTSTAGTPGDVEATVSSTAISSGNYYIGFQPDADAVVWRYQEGGGSMLYQIIAYGSFPPDPIAEAGSDTDGYRVGAYITP